MLERIVVALLGVVPPFLMLWYAEAFERRVREPHRDFRYRILVAVALASVPIGWAEHAIAALMNGVAEPRRSLFEAFIVAASIEETGKVLCLYLLTRLALAPGTRYGAFLYALHAAAGFALIENVVALSDAPSFGSLSVRFVLRGYMASPMHLFAGGVIGYLWARRRFDRGTIGLPGGLAIAIAIHGSYNALLLGVERLPATQPRLIVAAAVGAMLVPLLGVVVLRLLAGRLRRDDKRAGR
ncbi:MAG TPA: PrsW family glutamic-type intramembrane protease [Polyangiales bacterium]